MTSNLEMKFTSASLSNKFLLFWSKRSLKARDLRASDGKFQENDEPDL